jgi:hypothetical protein
MAHPNATPVRFTAAQMQAITAHCEATGLPRNRVVKLAIDQYLKIPTAAK